MRLSGLVAFAAVAVMAFSVEAASIEIFGAAQNGDFFDGDSPIHNGNRFNAIRRANNGGSHFVGNWVLTQSGFGGIDQVRNSGGRHLLANDGVTTIGIAFANSGSDGGTPPVNGGGSANQNADDDTLPSGAFAQVFNVGDTISFSADFINNNDGETFDYEIALLFDGETDLVNRFTVGSGTFEGPPGSTGTATFGNVTGKSDALTAAATSFNVVVIADNSNGGGDQVGIDNVVLSLHPVPEPTAIALSLLGIAGVVARRRR